MFCFYAENIASFRLVAVVWMTFDLSCNLSSIKSNDFHNSISLFCCWNAFFRRVSIETFWLHQRNIIETRSIKCLVDYWHRTPRENMISSSFVLKIYIKIFKKSMLFFAYALKWFDWFSSKKWTIVFIFRSYIRRKKIEAEIKIKLLSKKTRNEIWNLLCFFSTYKLYVWIFQSNHAFVLLLLIHKLF